MFSFVTAQYQWYKLEFGLTLLSPWEVFTFNAIVLFVLSATAYFSLHAIDYLV
ncbi:hypothetical protein H310_02192 [Aphanomyces invadans]|uniref:Uncharacterized protein n=1 Tax=Aphanomyces invadans TaxID=157072 RepID=A0A024UNI2_9STRA|nr:hypothetical protein H310_02192 [Aphanomyces invadans]ETW07750.1 hypothetical protein H310_02192 [Aphanomyces invadans]|eukprot:XP_008863843.1 hypothetical protein H310_02192 [Aphanomyces invadans]